MILAMVPCVHACTSEHDSSALHMKRARRPFAAARRSANSRLPGTAFAGHSDLAVSATACCSARATSPNHLCGASKRVPSFSAQRGPSPGYGTFMPSARKAFTGQTASECCEMAAPPVLKESRQTPNALPRKP